MVDPPPPLPPKELPINRFKFIWRVLMVSNLALGAYMFVGARNRDIGLVHRKAEKGKKNHKPAVEVPPAPTETTVVEVPPPPTTTSTAAKTWDM